MLKSFVLLLFLSVISAHPFTDCGSTLIVTKSVTLTPDPPHSGKLLHIKATAFVKETLISGTVHIDMKVLDIQVYSTTLDVCKVSSVSCPIKQSASFSILYSQQLPSNVPSGTYEVDIMIDDQTGKQVGCIKMNVPISAAAEAA